MEATREADSLLDEVRPPRLEDAGLEDCALPPESIKEAFLKAATAVGSRATSIFGASDEERDASEDEQGRCLNDPWSSEGNKSDTLVGVREDVDPPAGACEPEKGGGMPEVMGDKVAAGVTNDGERADKVVLRGLEEGGEACVDRLRGLKIGNKGKKLKDKEEEEEERKKMMTDPPWQPACESQCPSSSATCCKR